MIINITMRKNMYQETFYRFFFEMAHNKSSLNVLQVNVFFCVCYFGRQLQNGAFLETNADANVFLHNSSCRFNRKVFFQALFLQETIILTEQLTFSILLNKNCSNSFSVFIKAYRPLYNKKY